MIRIAVFEEDALVSVKIHECLYENLQHIEEDISIEHFEDSNLLIEKSRVKPFLFVYLSLKYMWEAFETSGKLWQTDEQCRIIFLTEGDENLFEAFKYPFFHIVRKDRLDQDLQVSIEKIKRECRKKSQYILLHTAGTMKKIRLPEILYIESNKHMITVHTQKEILTITDTLTQLTDRLSKSGFLRSHKSYLVNMYHILALHKETIELENGEHILLSRHRAPEARQKFEQYIRRLEWLE